MREGWMSSLKIDLGDRFHYERVLCEGTFMNTRWNKWRNWLGNEG
jgi:hypothetical protein